MKNLKDKIKVIVFEEMQKIQERSTTPFSKENVKSVFIRVFFDKEIPTYDILTGIRIIKNVATVYAGGPTLVSKMGRDVIDIKVNYIPVGQNHFEYIEFLANKIKEIQGVRVVKILKIGKKDLNRSDIGEKIKTVY